MCVWCAQVLGKLNVAALVKHNVDTTELVRHTVLLQEFLWTVSRSTCLHACTHHLLTAPTALTGVCPCLCMPACLSCGGVRGQVLCPSQHDRVTLIVDLKGVTFADVTGEVSSSQATEPWPTKASRDRDKPWHSAVLVQSRKL